jgi:hypothetical protein
VCAISTNSTTGEQCVDTDQTSQRICARNKPPANIAEPVAAITNYASGAGECTRAGANRSADNQNIGNGEFQSGKGCLRRAMVDDLPCGNNNHVSKEMPIHNRDTELADRPLVYCEAFHYVVEA